MTKCKLLSPWSSTEEVVAEGRWQCQEPNALVDRLPLGPNADNVFVDVVCEPDTFLWRPRPEMTYLRDSMKHFVACPASKCVFESTTDSPSRTSPKASTAIKSASQSATNKSLTPATCAASSPSSKSLMYPISPKAIPKNTQTPSPVRRSQVKFVVYGLK